MACEELPGQYNSTHAVSYTSLKASQWVHVACVVGRGLLQLYVNGVCESSKEVETHCRYASPCWAIAVVRQA